MKKLFSIALVVTLMLACFSGCSINKNEVSILWRGEEAEAVNPNSLINAMDRAMYISNIQYKHYAANGDQAAQTKQAETALNAGCEALVVQLVDNAAAQTIVDLAKAKNIPVVFFDSDVDAAVVNGYEKCALVKADDARLSEGYSAMLYMCFGPTMEKQIKAQAKGKEKDGFDKDGDGKITYLNLADIEIALPSAEAFKDYGQNKVPFNKFQFVSVDGTLADLEFKAISKEKKGLFSTSVVEYGQLVTADGKVVEAIFTNDDQEALEILVELQKLDMNTDKLSTHFIPVITVGANADYKEYVMKDMPTDAAARAEHLEAFKQLVNMTTFEQEEWDKWTNKEKNEIDTMVYNTLNQVSAGKLSGTAVEDYDAIAVATAELAAAMIKGNAVTEKIVELPYAINIAG